MNLVTIDENKPEDVGGIWGYYDFMEALNDSKYQSTRAIKNGMGATLILMAATLMKSTKY
ncbi:MAG: hypothetical protein V3U88_03545 [Methylococcales bacterium]